MSLHEAFCQTDNFILVFIDQQMTGRRADVEIWKIEQEIIEEVFYLIKCGAERLVELCI